MQVLFTTSVLCVTIIAICVHTRKRPVPIWIWPIVIATASVSAAENTTTTAVTATPAILMVIGVILAVYGSMFFHQKPAIMTGGGVAIIYAAIITGIIVNDCGPLFGIHIGILLFISFYLAIKDVQKNE